MKGNKALVHESPWKRTWASRLSLTLVSPLPVKEEVLAKFKENTVKGAASSDSLCLNSPALAQAAARLLTQN